MKKRGLIIGIVAAVLLIVGIIFLHSYNPDKSQSDSSTAENEEQYTVLEIEDAEEIIVSGEQSVHFIKSDGEWTIDGYAKEDISGAKVSGFIAAALSYKTSGFPEEDDLSAYGLDNPILTVEIKADAKTHTVLIGSDSALDDVYFASANGKLFLMPSYQYEQLANPASYYTEFARLAINTETINGLRIETDSRVIDLYIPEITRMEGNVWRMREPYDTLANDEFIDSDVRPQLGSITLSKKSEVLGKEHARLIIKDESGKEYQLRIGEAVGESVNVEYNGSVYSEPAELFGFIDEDIFSYTNKLVSYIHIDDVAEYTVEYDGKKHIGRIDGDSFAADGKPADKDKSKAMYIELIGVVATGLYNNESLGETMLSVSFKGRDGSKDKRVEYKKINEYTAAAVNDGKVIFNVSAADIQIVKEKLNKYFE